MKQGTLENAVEALMSSAMFYEEATKGFDHAVTKRHARLLRMRLRMLTEALEEFTSSTGVTLESFERGIERAKALRNAVRGASR